MRCCCAALSCFAISPASFRRTAGDSAAISPASLSSKCLTFAHQFAVNIELFRARDELWLWRLRGIADMQSAAFLFDDGALGELQADVDAVSVV